MPKKLLMIHLKRSFLQFIFISLIFSSCDINDGPCERGKGPVVRQEVDVAAFEGVNFGMAGHVYIYRGEERKVEIEAEENILALIDTRVSNNVWNILPRECISNYEMLNIYITTPSISDISLTGSGSIIVENVFEEDEVDISLPGSGNISFQGTTQTTGVILSGAGEIDLAGATNFLDIRLSGSGGVKAFDMLAGQARVSLSGSGSVEVQFADSLMAVVSGSGFVYYRGASSKVNKDTPGSGGVEPTDN